MSTYPFDGKKLMTPGPVPMPKDVLMSLSQHECHHRSKEFGEILKSVLQRLPKIFQTEQPACMLASTGSGALEALMVNCLTTKKPILTINAGKFGERWGKIAKAFNIPFEEIVVPWGQDIPLDIVENKLAQGSYQALCFQACETSTGALLPVKELATLAKKHKALSLVDAITALGAAPLPMDEWGLDGVAGGSQKAFMLPTGMAFVALSEKAQAVESDIPKYYFDLRAERASNAKGKTRYSTPTQFVIGLDMVLNKILDETGLDNHLKDIQRKAELFRNEVNLEIFPQTSSPSLTCLKVPEGANGALIKDKVDEAGFIIVGGQDQLKGKVLRVGHMGAMSDEDLLLTARAINQAL